MDTPDRTRVTSSPKPKGAGEGTNEGIEVNR
jgi:hypothetical protein